MAIERTFLMIKPDATRRNSHGCDHQVLEGDAGLRVIASKRVWMSRREAEGYFYAVHKERPFFGELVEFSVVGANDRPGCSKAKNAIARKPRSDGRHQPGQRRRRHDPQGARAVDRRKLGAWLRRPETAAQEIRYWFSDTEIVG